MAAELDLDDVAAQSPKAMAELVQLRAYADALNERCIADAPDAERYRYAREHAASVGMHGSMWLWDQPDRRAALDSMIDGYMGTVSLFLVLPNVGAKAQAPYPATVGLERKVRALRP